MKLRTRPFQPIQDNQVVLQTNQSLRKEAQICLDGTPVVIRPVQSNDAKAILAMHERLSLETVRLRYFSPRTPSADEISQLCKLPKSDGQAIVVAPTSEPDTIIGIAYFIIDKGQQSLMAEPAFLVEDAYQGQGLGQLLFQHLCQYAILKGIRVFEAMVNPSNRPMLHILRNGGFPVEDKFSYGTRELQIWLTSNAHINGDKQ